MIQEVLTYLFIAYAIAYVLYHIAKVFIPIGNNKQHACGTGCSSCSVKPDQMPSSFQIDIDRLN